MPMEHLESPGPSQRGPAGAQLEATSHEGGKKRVFSDELKVVAGNL